MKQAALAHTCVEFLGVTISEALRQHAKWRTASRGSRSVSIQGDSNVSHGVTC